MAQKEFTVRTIGIEYICDICNNGTMEQMGIMLPVDPPKWKHKCNNCGGEMDLYEKYPTVRWEKVNI